MQPHFLCRISGAACVAACLLAPAAQGGQIMFGQMAGPGGGTVGPALLVPSPPGAIDNNVLVGDPGQDDPSDDTGVRFTPTLAWTSSAPIVVAFDVRDSVHVTEYLMGVTFHNESPQTWTGLSVELGYMNGSGGFVAATFDGLDFDTSPLDVNGPQTPSYHVNGPNLFSYFAFFTGSWVRPQIVTDGYILVDTTQFLNDQIEPNTYSHFLQFAVDVPNDPGLSVWQQGTEDYQFALRFTPIPEPASGLALSALATALLARRR